MLKKFELLQPFFRRLSKMWFIQCFCLFFLVLLTAKLSMAQDASVSTTQWEFQKILGELVDRQNRVRSMIDKLEPKVKHAYDEVKPNNTVPLTEAALDALRNSLTTLKTLDSYDVKNKTWTCDEIVVRSGGINFDIQRSYQIYYEVLRNVTVLYERLGSCNTGYAINYYTLNDKQRSSVQSVVTSLYILIDEFNQYGLALLTAVYQYTRLNNQLLYVKENICNCPTILSNRSATALATVDSGINLVQTNIIDFERQIRDQSATTIKFAKAINPNLKLNSTYLLLTQTLDNIITLVHGYLVLDTNDVIKVTTTCDEAAMKIAFIQYKMDQYYQINIEAQKNSTFVIVLLGYLNVYNSANTYTLSESQKQAIQSVVTSMNSLIDKFRNYVLSLYTAWSKLFVLNGDARSARSGSCQCIAGSTLAGLTSAVTTMVTGTTQKLSPVQATTTTPVLPTLGGTSAIPATTTWTTIPLTTTSPVTTRVSSTITTISTTIPTTTTATLPTSTTTIPSTTTRTTTLAATSTLAPTTPTTTTPITTTPTTTTPTTTTPTTTTPTTTTPTTTTPTTTTPTTTTPTTTTPTTTTPTTTTPTTTTPTATTPTTTPTTTPKATETTTWATTTIPTTIPTTTQTTTLATTTPAVVQTTTTVTTPPPIDTRAADTTTTPQTTATTVKGGKPCSNAATEISITLKDPSGNYLKTACFNFANYTQTGADTYCKKNQMALFRIDSNATQTALFNYLEPLVNTTSAVFRIDGVRDEAGDNKWYNNDKTAVHTGLDWLMTADTPVGWNSLCVTNMFFPMHKVIKTLAIDGLEPTYEFNSICEFKE